MKNLKPLSIEQKNAIDTYTNLQKLTLLCDEILSAPILKTYRPRIYEMAQYMHESLLSQIAPSAPTPAEIKSAWKTTLKIRVQHFQPCCKMPEIFCQCNAD